MSSDWLALVMYYTILYIRFTIGIRHIIYILYTWTNTDLLLSNLSIGLIQLCLVRCDNICINKSKLWPKGIGVRYSNLCIYVCTYSIFEKVHDINNVLKARQISERIWYYRGRKCSGQKKPDYSWGRPSEALGSWGSGNLEGGGFGWWVGQRGSVYKQPETEVDDSCHS